MESIINDYDLWLKKDKDGNIIEILAGSDYWGAELLEKLAPFINNESYILFVDDGRDYWKAEFIGGQVRYYKQDK